MKLSKERLAEIRARLGKYGAIGHVDTGALFDHIDALEAEKANDPVRRFLAHPMASGVLRYVSVSDKLTFAACRSIGGGAPGTTATYSNTSPDEACAAALRALESEGSDD